MHLSKLAWNGVMAFLLFACSTAPNDPIAQAASEATAIVQQAQATAMIAAAHAAATALIGQAQGGSSQATKTQPVDSTTSTNFIIVATPEPATFPETVSTSEPTVMSQTVELLGVGFAAEGGFLMILYTAPPRIADQWYQGNVSVIDESNNEVYDQIPVMPVIGPLIAQPVEEGQRGYVMLMNRSPGLQPGSLVTVNLGEYKFEHIEFGK